jgi:hypothetical protein
VVEGHNSRTRYYLLLPPYSRQLRAPKDNKVIGAWLGKQSQDAVREGSAL